MHYTVPMTIEEMRKFCETYWVTCFGWENHLRVLGLFGRFIDLKNVIFIVGWDYMAQLCCRIS